MGKKALLKSATILDGNFSLDLSPLPKLPTNACIVFRDLSGLEIGRLEVTSDDFAGKHDTIPGGRVQRLSSLLAPQAMKRGHLVSE